MTEFWKATAIRAIKTVCQTAVATIGTAAVMSDVNWQFVISAAILAGILSVLTSIATGLPEVELEEELEDENDDEWYGNEDDMTVDPYEGEEVEDELEEE